MSEASEKPRPFDVRTIEYLVRLMSENDLSEVDLSEGEQRIRLRRGTRAAAVAAPLAPVAAAPAAASPVAPPAQAQPEKPSKKLLEIKSPTVGTFFHQRQPGDAPLVTVGSRVTPTTPVGVIMAMKVHNEVPAGCTGTIVEVCAGNDEFVEFNAVLFRVDPS